MIQHTFQILDKVAETKEKNIWQQDIHDWDSFINSNSVKGISDDKKSYFDRQLLKAKKAIHNYDSSYFIDKLQSTETWRLYDSFKEDAIFLDIETEGVAKHADITVVGLFDGLDTKTMIKGVNLDYNILKKELSKYKLIMTFNGSSFDIPFIRKRYDILPASPHIDVMHLCARLNLRGGLKCIEKQFGIQRSKIIERFYGGDVLTLWRMYKATGDKYYLELLVEYNEEDVFNLKKIMNYCNDRLKEQTKVEIYGAEKNGKNRRTLH
jgi:hypothetical protein